MRPYPTSKCRCWNPARAHDDPSCPVNRERRRERERANRLMRSWFGSADLSALEMRAMDGDR